MRVRMCWAWTLVLLGAALGQSQKPDEPPVPRLVQEGVKDPNIARFFQALREYEDRPPAEALRNLAPLLDHDNHQVRTEAQGFLKKPAVRQAYLATMSEAGREALEKADGKEDDRITQLISVVRKYEPTDAAKLALGEIVIELVRRNRVEEVRGARRLLEQMEPDSRRWPLPVLDALNSLDCRRKDLAPEAEAPGAKVLWSEFTAQYAATQEALRTHEKILRDKQLPIPVGPRPTLALAVVFGGNGEALAWNGASGLYSHDPIHGKRFWSGPTTGCLDVQFRSAFRVGYITNAAQQLKGTTALFDNSRTGHLSAGNGFVYKVDDLVVRSSLPPEKQQPLLGRDFDDRTNRNRLQAWSMATGKLRWHVGEPWMNSDPRFHEGFFLGAPLVLGESLLALHERDMALRVVRLDGRTGAVQDMRHLGQLTVSLGRDGVASRRGHHLLAWDGTLIVPTGCGEILALDLPTLTPRWRYVYPEEAGVKPGPGIAFEPRVVGDRLFYAGPDSRKLHALDAKTGKALWTVPVADDDLDFTTTHAGAMLVIGTKEVRLLDGDTGKERWKLATGTPAGQGYEGKGDLFYQPIYAEKGDSVAVLDLKQGKEIRRIAMPDRLRLGNLLPIGPRQVANLSIYELCVLEAEK